MRPISLVVLCAAVVAIGSDALAGPLEESVLRGSAAPSYDDGPVAPRFVPGSPVVYRWEGLYLGAHAGYTGLGVDFGHGTQSLLNELLGETVVGLRASDWTTLPSANSNSTVFGGFIGYNFQSDELTFGVEANYNRVGASGATIEATKSFGRQFSDDSSAPPGHHFTYDVFIDNAARARLTDFATLRARAGFVMDKFMPYGFAGFALGRVDVLRSLTVSYTAQDNPDPQTPPNPPLTPVPPPAFGPASASEQRDGVFAYGFTAGLGIDVAIMPNMFMRAEWEYVQFAPVEDFKININTVRAGLGLRF
jgi:outer membrane immunogenic protein